jgi:sugar lactone lactonase YvrE
MSDGALELVVNSQSAVGEGAVWHAQKQRLYWVNILAGLVHIYEPADDRNLTIKVGDYVSSVVPRAAGGLAVTVQHGFAAMDAESGRMTMLREVEHDLPRNRFNDGKCDPAGRYWAGTMALDGSGHAGSLYALERDHTVRRVLEGIGVANGLAWSLDRRAMYFIDTSTRRVTAYDYRAATGALSNPRPVITFAEADGWPDGMTIDSQGMLWIAHWQGGQVSRWNPRTGQRLDAIAVPAPLVTSCAFGGPDLDHLYITTARSGLKPEALETYPHAGGLFRAYPGVRGVPAFEYGG